MKEFEVQITDVTQPEFLQATRQLGLRYYFGLIILIIILTVVITVFTGQITALSIGFPLLVLAVVPVAYDMMAKKNFRTLGANAFEMTYRINDAGWRVIVGEETAIHAWSATYKLRETKDAFLLYDTKTTSSLLPKRLLTPEQQDFVRAKGKAA